MQYRERPKPRSTAAATPRIVVQRLAVAVLGAALLGAGCAKPPPPEPAPVAEVAEVADIPEGVLLAEQAPPFYSLQQSSDGRHWIAVFADAADLTLRLARGSLDAHTAQVDEVITVDRIDVVPGINPYFGRHAYLQHAGLEHLFYTDQELADARVTKWIYRGVDGTDPWTVDLLPDPVVPVAVLPGAETGSEHPGFTLFGVLGDAEQEPVLAYDVRPQLLPEDSAPIFGGARTHLAGAASVGASAPGPALSAFHCAGRHGVSMAATADDLLLFEVLEDGPNERRITLPKRTSAPPEPAAPSTLPVSVGCTSPQLLVLAYARDDRKAVETGAGSAGGAHEIVALAIDRDGAVSAERKVTLARDVRALAVFPDPATAASPRGQDAGEHGEAATAEPMLTVLFSELALDGAGEPEHRLSLVAPDAEGTYRKSTLAHGSGPVQDARVLRAGGNLVVMFRRANELHLLLTALPAPAAAAAAQSGGSW